MATPPISPIGMAASRAPPTEWMNSSGTTVRLLTFGVRAKVLRDAVIAWVSDARIESYHTVWYELHEDLLRLMQRERSE